MNAESMDFISCCKKEIENIIEGVSGVWEGNEENTNGIGFFFRVKTKAENSKDVCLFFSRELISDYCAATPKRKKKYQIELRERIKKKYGSLKEDEKQIMITGEGIFIQ